MSTKILIKRSSTASAVPTIADIDVGELAINLVDKRLYANNNGTIIEIGTNATAQTAGTLTVTGVSTLDSGSVTGNWSVGGTLSIQPPVNNTDAATKKYVDDKVAAVLDGAPELLDTLNELAAALGDDPDFVTTITDSIATKLPLAGGTMTGSIDLGANGITTTADPSTDNHLVRKGYIVSIYGSMESAAASAAAASTSETNAALSATSASTSATNASLSEANASTSATNAATSATNAASSETSASSSATAAATSATAAATSAVNADNSADIALDAQTASEAAQLAAETAASTATGALNIYVDIPTALAATVDGDYFSVPNTDQTYVTLYRNDSGTETFINSQYAKAKVDEIEDTQVTTAFVQAAAISQLQAQLVSSIAFPD